MSKPTYPQSISLTSRPELLAGTGPLRLASASGARRFSTCVSLMLFELTLLMLGGCQGGREWKSTDTSESSPDTGDTSPVADAILSASSMEITIESPVPNTNDGIPTTAVTATVFTPEHREGETYPLILHANRWSGSRTSQADVDAEDPDAPFSTEEYFVVLDRHVETLWNAGFAVVSFDQRGHGRGDDGDDGTADGAHASPDYEVQDAIAVLDWAVENLDVTMEGPGDPVVGLLGGSYGANFQPLFAALDPRIDALMLGGGWHSMRESMAPNGVIKKGYAFALQFLALNDSIEYSDDANTFFGEMAIDQTTKFTEGLSDITRDILMRGGIDSFANAGMPAPAVDALIVHGNRDILLNLNQALGNLDYLSSAGGDVRLITHENGHSLVPLRSGPGAQGTRGPNGCGPIDVFPIVVSWFDAKLRGNESAIKDLPRYCISLDDTHAASVDAMPRGSNTFQVEIPAGTTVNATNNNYLSPADEAVFIPLNFIIDKDDLVLLGQPHARVTVDDAIPTDEGLVFIGIGIRRAGTTLLVDDQIIPVRSSDPRTNPPSSPIPLAAVGERLQAGDEVGVVLFGTHDQFENEARSNWISNAAEVSGFVEIPIITSPEILVRQ